MLNDFMLKMGRAVSPYSNIEILDRLVAECKDDPSFKENWYRYTTSTYFHATMSRERGTEPVSLFIILMDDFVDFVKRGGV
ncbi:MAG: hypothetical protein CBD78_00090 [Candidatus Thioglobus sp. TMED218]|nr:MAG: hypothetical protein CBD78_00090 [Candidatus Thioglobus sp. TMED218]